MDKFKNESNPNYIIREGCRKCGTTENLTLNHIVPLSAGGTDKEENLEVLCQKCNNLEYKEIVKKALEFYFKHRSA